MTEPRTVEAARAMPAAPPSAWRRFLRNPKGIVAASILVLLVFAVIFGPIIDQAKPNAINLGETLAGPSATHPLGTDENGRDELARILVGGRASLAVGLATMLIAMFLGVAIGSVSGFFGGRIDTFFVQLIDGAMAIPLFFLWLVALSVIAPTILTISVIVGVTSWMSTARVIRSEVLRARHLEFVDAARSLGAGRRRLLFKHCLPQATSAAIVAATLATAYAILTESALSYLGIGIQPPTASWGNMLSGAQQYIFTKPMLAVWPGIAIGLTVLCLNLVGDALRDVLDPRSRK